MRKKILNLTLAAGLALSLLVGGAATTTNQAAAYNDYTCNWYYQNGGYRCVPMYCYDEYKARQHGYFNSKTCVYNHLGYQGIYW